MKVVVTGSRYWLSEIIIKERLSKLPRNSVIIHGGQRGADKMAEKIAKEIGLQTVEFRADWNRHGKPAGPIRNAEMLDTHPDIVIAFHENLNKSKGTLDCVRQATERKIPVELIDGTSRGTANTIGLAERAGKPVYKYWSEPDIMEGIGL